MKVCYNTFCNYMAFNLTTEKFEGPLDLMLHLIREQKLDIFDLDMEVLTDQYLAYLNKMEELHLEIESEYLLELAILIEYKSKKLLPKDEKDEDLQVEDPKELLVQRLLEYQKYKEASYKLNDSYISRQEIFSKSPSYEDYLDKDSDENKIEGNPNDLFKAMNRMLRKMQLSKPINTSFANKEISIDDRILEIKAQMVDLPSTFSFDDLVTDVSAISEYIITFLAILDLIKDHILLFSIDDMDNIYLKKAGFN